MMDKRDSSKSAGKPQSSVNVGLNLQKENTQDIGADAPAPHTRRFAPPVLGSGVWARGRSPGPDGADSGLQPTIHYSPCARSEEQELPPSTELDMKDQLGGHEIVFLYT